ncbi:MAG: PQQ-binding-like beta-propeller repeat protein [Candidatus Aegiribacteria sp.]|nr:PQQ-binding-like beta-propeller repeat protein [Candidatus Aegiribacteria sp.]MBD3294837.1 PQQ-binding-like beta-propeller repeat protein [Candidatus Fermentibacteria bacterium]
MKGSSRMKARYSSGPRLSFLTVMLCICMSSISYSQIYPNIEWWTDLDAPSLGSAATADLDGDGKPEIVFGTYFNDETIHCLNGEDGSHLWTFFTDGCNDASPLICDADGDGALEVIVPGSSTQTVYCLSGDTGGLEWSAFQGYCIDSPPAAADLDGDGELEIVNGTFNGNVFCLNGSDGSIAWQCSLGTDSYIQSCPNIHDFDGDGELEIVVAQWLGDFKIFCLNGSDGEIEWTCDTPGDNMYHGAAFADVDQDGMAELTIGSYDGNVYMINGEDGTVQWSYPAGSYACGPTSIADFDSDGQFEVFYAAGSGVGVITPDGDQMWHWSTGATSFRGAAVTNIDGDTVPDVIYGTSQGMLYARKGTAGELLWELDLQAHYGDTYDIDHAPVTGDFDSDGSVDVFVVGGYATSSSPHNNHGRAYMVSAGANMDDLWPTFRHDSFRSGCFYGSGTGIEGSEQNTDFSEITAFPNPAGAVLHLGFTPGVSGWTEIAVHDISGRKVLDLYSGDVTDGENSIEFSTSGLAPGIYFVRVRFEGTEFSSSSFVVLN